MSSSFLYFVYRFWVRCRVFLFFYTDLVEVTVPFSDIFLSALLGFFLSVIFSEFARKDKKETGHFRVPKTATFKMWP